MRSSDHIPGFSRTSETDKKDNSNEFSDRLLASPGFGTSFAYPIARK